MASHLPVMYSSTHLWESTWFRLMRSSYTAHKPYTYRVVHDQLMLLANTNTQLSGCVNDGGFSSISTKYEGVQKIDSFLTTARTFDDNEQRNPGAGAVNT
ncbi:hypothetical protein Bca4012_096507 [Brassica carinata]